MGKRSSMARFLLGCFGPSSTKRLRHTTDEIIEDIGAIEKPVDSKIDSLSMGLRRFSWKEIEEVSMSFSEVIGLGGYSTVYRARLGGSAMAAVKVYNSSERLNKVFRSEMEVNSIIRHPNVVKLVGFCDERDEGVLVFKYIPHGTLQEKLHNKSNSSQVLPWKARMAIAYQLGQALDYLHEQQSPHIIHGDIKASNILLLDENNTQTYCKLCDFGFAKICSSSAKAPNSSSSRLAMMGSPGYIDPHYLMTGLASKKNDVYSFGVILLELITGIEAFPSERQQLLTSMARTSNGSFDMEKVMGMVDPRLGGGANMEEARAIACIAAMCLHHLPSLRPSTTEIGLAMRDNIGSISFLFESSKL